MEPIGPFCAVLSSENQLYCNYNQYISEVIMSDAIPFTASSDIPLHELEAQRGTL